MKIICSFLFVILITSIPLLSQTINSNRPPIIDMHLHAQEEIWRKTLPFRPEPYTIIQTEIQDIDELLPRTVEEMNKYNIVLGVLSEENLDELYRWKEYDSRFLLGTMVREPADADIDRIRKDLENGKLAIMGEIASQYYNYAINDPALDPFLKLAEEYDIPVLIHCYGLGGGTNFPITKGNPLLVSEVIRKHPNLRIYLENAGWPFLEETISLMYCYTNVYADLSTITWVIKRDTFYKYLKGLLDADLGKRLMFGSDQMIWPETIGMAIDAIESADFLTEEQKRDIFFNNAVRFLRLDEAEILK
jgi:predicted TIM-barrel fold metal-dependent hydrolase